jgi:hypothetical protein
VRFLKKEDYCKEDRKRRQLRISNTVVFLKRKGWDLDEETEESYIFSKAERKIEVPKSADSLGYAMRMEEVVDSIRIVEGDFRWEYLTQ